MHPVFSDVGIEMTTQNFHAGGQSGGVAGEKGKETKGKKKGDEGRRGKAVATP